jgi:hypothetical protein
VWVQARDEARFENDAGRERLAPEGYARRVHR